MSDWYQQTTDEVIAKLSSSAQSGLTEEEAARRLEQYGPNELEERGTKGPWQILFAQFKETMVVILVVAAIISYLVGEATDAIVVMAIVVLNALLGFRQEYQAEQAMAALKKLAVPIVRVRRNGHIQELSARTLVPGDMVLLEAGNLVPADARLVESVNLRAQEAALTGESEPVIKEVVALPKEGLSLGDRHNMVYMGTVISYGRGTAVVTSTGMKTELGGIANLLQGQGDEDTPLQRRLDQLGKYLAVLAVILVAIVFGLGLLRGDDIRELLLTSISMAVAAVPEGLAAVVTISLALGARRMLNRRALIRKLPAVEALGSVTVICSDKTGTLTENRMTVTVLDVANHEINLTQEERPLPLFAADETCVETQPTPEQAQTLREHPALALLLAGGALCNDAILECEENKPGFRIVGDPTEGALVVAAARTGLVKEDLEKTFPRVAEVPFDSDRKRMTTVHRMPAVEADVPSQFSAVWNWGGWAGAGQSNYVSFTKGAMDSLLTVTDQVWVDDQLEPLTPQWIDRIEHSNAALAEHGMRVLGVALRRFNDLPEKPDVDNLEHNLVFVGLVAMIDPARAEVRDAVATCKTAGIRPIMITGDHPLTARYIASELGISANGQVITGQELEQMPEDQLIQTVRETNVYARVSPEHKLRIVNALQKQGEIVAMTGDGVNDAPALRTADIGVAMGITGTDVSKEASDMVLLDDNFATIVSAVEEGRTIYDNIRKFIKYTMTSNLGEIWVMLLSPFLGMPLALAPLQILWINLVTDGVPGLALGVENPERNTMHRPPYPPNENIFARGIGRDILVIGFLMGIISLGVGYVYWLRDSTDFYWRTMIFTTLTLSEMGYVMAIRSNRDSLFTIGPFSNRAMILAVGFTTLLQVAILYIPFTQELLELQPLALPDLLVCFALSTLLFFVVEFQKWLSRRREQE